MKHLKTALLVVSATAAVIAVLLLGNLHQEILSKPPSASVWLVPAPTSVTEEWRIRGVSTLSLGYHSKEMDCLVYVAFKNGRKAVCIPYKEPKK